MAEEVHPVSGDFAAGAQVAGYRLGEQVGWGGMAAVYRAYDIRLGRWVALKILAPEIASDASFRQGFISESRAAAAVDHPHIIPVFEAGEAGGVLFIAMRYVGGGDVRMLVRRHGPLDAARAGSIVGQVASALDAAHAAALVHRDVKPANMLLAAAAGGGYPDHVYLSDFGLSRQALSAAGPALSGQFAGTLNYMAPEQIKGRPVDGRADLYALACAAFEMLAGEPPFRREEDLGPLGVQLAVPPLLLTSLRSDLPPAIDLVLARAMADSPDDRYESCIEFAASLLRACGLEWGASGQLLAGSPGVAMALAAPLLTAGPAAAKDLADAPAAKDLADAPAARDLADAPAANGHAAEPGCSPAQLLPPPPLTRTARVSVRAGPAAVAPGLADLGMAADRPGWQGPVMAAGRPAWPRPGGQGPGWQRPGPPVPRGRSRGGSPVIAVAVFVVILAIAGAAFLALRAGGASPSRHAARALPFVAAGPNGHAHPGSRGSAGGQGSPSAASNPRSRRRPAASAGPAATVSAYIAAINSHHYGRAWELGGRNSSVSYPTFVEGFGTTAKDTLIILSVSGNVVTAELVAQQTDGTVKTYRGTYTVDGGVITTTDIDQIS